MQTMKGILFSKPMYDAVINSSKTMTRRLIKPQPICLQGRAGGRDIGNPVGENGLIKPRYLKGETVYLKEPIRLDIDAKTLHLKYSDVTVPIELPTNFPLVERFMKLQNRSKIGYYPKMYIPIWISKDIFRKIEILSVKAERLQDISDSDCESEGIVPEWQNGFVIGWRNKTDGITYEKRKQAFAALINSIKKGAWERNEWYWAYSFKLIK